MPETKIREIEAEFKKSELTWRSHIQDLIDEILRHQRERALKYDHFIDMLIAREKEREELRKAIIHHGTMVALGAVAIFALNACWQEIVSLVRGAK